MRKRTFKVIRCIGCGANARYLRKTEILKVGRTRHKFRWARCPRCTKTFLLKEPS